MKTNNFYKPSSTAERLEEAMRMRSKKPADLSKETGIDRGSISHYLSGKYEPKDKAICKLALALDVDEMWLWGYDVPMKRPLIEANENDEGNIISDITLYARKNKTFCDTVYSLIDNQESLDIVNRMQIDKEFHDLVITLCGLDDKKLQSASNILNTFLKQLQDNIK